MFISGFISAFLMLFGAYFKIMHWPGANVMLVLGMLTLAIVFLPLMFTLRLREKTEKRDKAVLILGLFSAIYFLIGALFKFMHWPGAGIFVLTGIPFLLFVFLPVYIVNGIKNPAAKVNTIVTAILIIAGSGFVMVLPSKSNVYSIPSKLNNLKNEEMVLAQMQELADDSLRTDLKQAYEDFMKSAKDFKNLITELSSQVEYDTYIEDLASNSTEASYGTRLREYPELNKFISAVINFEARSQTKIYNYEDYMAYNAPDRKSQIDYALVSHPNVKDLLGTIILTQQEATLALAKR